MNTATSLLFASEMESLFHYTFYCFIKTLQHFEVILWGPAACLTWLAHKLNKFCEFYRSRWQLYAVSIKSRSYVNCLEFQWRKGIVNQIIRQSSHKFYHEISITVFVVSPTLSPNNLHTVSILSIVVIRFTMFSPYKTQKNYMISPYCRENNFPVSVNFTVCKLC